MKLPRGQGMWPAFWLLGDNIGSVGWPTSGEIDIMENVGKEPTAVHGSMHGPGYSGGNPLTGTYSGPTFADAFHTFAVDWAPDSVAFSVDGVQYERHTPADTNGNQWVFNHPFFTILNLAVGGTWPGSPTGATSFPQQLVVDCVHVNAQGSTGGGSTGGGSAGGAIKGFGGKCVDVAAANGTKVQLYDCNGTNAQKWTIGSDGTIMALGKCLDATGVSSADGTARPCRSGTARVAPTRSGPSPEEVPFCQTLSLIRVRINDIFGVRAEWEYCSTSTLRCLAVTSPEGGR